MKYICYVCGYTCDENNIPEKCPQCNCHSAHFEKMDMRYELRKISTDKSFVDAMMKLYEQDPIEYSIKLAQFKEIADNKRKAEEAERLIPKCPKCGSKSITTGQKGYGLVMGFLGSNKTVNRCGSCGHTWQPKK